MSHVLVVEDSSTMRTCLGRLLDKEGYTCTLSSNGRDAWTTLYTTVPDLILLDLTMPELDGVAFLRQLRDHHHWHGLPVVVLTGEAPDSPQVRRAKKLGVCDVVHKGTLAVTTLMPLVRHLLASRVAASVTVA